MPGSFHDDGAQAFAVPKYRIEIRILPKDEVQPERDAMTLRGKIKIEIPAHPYARANGRTRSITPTRIHEIQKLDAL